MFLATDPELDNLLVCPALFLGELSVISFPHSALGPSVSPNGLLMRF